MAPIPIGLTVSNRCREAYISINRALSTWRRSVSPVVPIGVRCWLFVVISGFVWSALFAVSITAIGARAQPIVTRIMQTEMQSVYLFDGIPPYTDECTLDGVSTVDTLPPDLTVEYAKADAFCTSDGNGNGRLTLLATGKCRLIMWQGAVIESPCTRLPIVVMNE